MLIPYPTLVKNYHITPTGVLHVGANTGEEAESYITAGITRIMWVEARDTAYNQLMENMQQYSARADIYCIRACVSDCKQRQVPFHIASNQGQSSSLLQFGTHTRHHPEVKMEKTIQLPTTTLDDIIADTGINVTDFDFLNMDLQGAELLALKGMKKNLAKVNYAYIEVNQEDVYQGCPHMEEIDQYLAAYGLLPVQQEITNACWGDKFYMKKTE